VACTSRSEQRDVGTTVVDGFVLLKAGKQADRDGA
jgi:hypothetical protein